MEELFLEAVRMGIMSNYDLTETMLVVINIEGKQSVSLINVNDMSKCKIFPLCFFVKNGDSVNYENISKAIKQL